ncbi:MAG TPA: hypothetical protein VH740_16320 [Vicinamibacterales bacterium]|jgi:Tol biopolymer transport system component
MNPRHYVWAIAIVVCAASWSEAQTTTRVSVATGGAQADLSSVYGLLTPDGRYVVFGSSATNLVAGDTNDEDDVFVHDRQTGTTERVSVGTGGVQGNNGTGDYAISADGRYVAFVSAATNLVAGDTNGATDVFVRDRQTSTTTRVSVATGGIQATGGFSNVPVISADGRFVAFFSGATNLVAGDTNGLQDVFLHDRQTGTTTRVNVATGGAQATGGASSAPAISGDGRFVIFSSTATNLVAGDTNAASDIFVRDTQAGTTTRVSVGPAGIQANAGSFSASVSADGVFITFVSLATNLEPGGGTGVFVHDRGTATTAAAVVVPPGTPINQRPDNPGISGNGRFIGFTSRFSNHVPGDTNGDLDVFVFDRQLSTVQRVNVHTNGQQADGFADFVRLNGDGTVAVFSSFATNLVDGDTNGESDVFVRTLSGGGGPTATMSLDKTSLRFGAVTNGASFLFQTSTQTVRLAQTGAGAVSWTASSNQPWLQISPASGSGSATLSVSVLSTAAISGVVTGTVTFTFTGAANNPGPINVALNVLQNGTSVGPFGHVDTPIDNRTGVTGAVPFTGWALDDIEIQRVAVCRFPFGAEVAPPNPNCGGAPHVFIGFAVMIDGARPDVAAAFPTYPRNTSGGWGFMVLTNMLPSQGNGTYVFVIHAQDREGAWTQLGTRTMTCANATATLPFGAIDTPEQGGVASGAGYINFGWALTPMPKTIPTDGSTITVMVDGISLGSVSYNHFRSDIASLFPGFSNTNGAIGFRVIDTTLLANGTHTIVWVVTDNAGTTQGIGSRFFTVSNGVGAVTASSATAGAVPVPSPSLVASLPAADDVVWGRRGFDLDAPFDAYRSTPVRRITLRGEEIDRFELALGERAGTSLTGYVRVGSELSPLPIGSQLDPATGAFTWTPGVGFVGNYDLVFVRWDGATPIERREVRIAVHPKGMGR